MFTFLEENNQIEMEEKDKPTEVISGNAVIADNLSQEEKESALKQTEAKAKEEAEKLPDDNKEDVIKLKDTLTKVRQERDSETSKYKELEKKFTELSEKIIQKETEEKLQQGKFEDLYRDEIKKSFELAQSVDTLKSKVSEYDSEVTNIKTGNDKTISSLNKTIHAIVDELIENWPEEGKKTVIKDDKMSGPERYARYQQMRPLVDKMLSVSSGARPGTGFSPRPAEDKGDNLVDIANKLNTLIPY